MIGLVIFAVGLYIYLLSFTKGVYNADGTVVEEQKFYQQVEAGLITFVYSVIVIALGYLYQYLAINQTEAENYRYQKQYIDNLINRLFKFNIFNYYLPLIIVAFDPSNQRSFVDLFLLMVVQMSVQQISLNLYEYFRPLVMTKEKLK